jgi:aspartate kinase
MRNNPIIVQKYGGACLETPAKIRAVASRLADLHSRGHRVVAIVSAMGKTTDELVKMAYQVSPHPNRRELDMLLTTGDSALSPLPCDGRVIGRTSRMYAASAAQKFWA